ncbi:MOLYBDOPTERIN OXIDOREDUCTASE, MEMBRANE SUBUNIT [hydrothermal vent metagenome]|uniref:MOLYBDOPTERIN OXIDOREDUCTASE, MEMBRANE SUBUNIT n=1 Tax=hydrothermal vent metagenome TaxID=652676 RepID=A0A1W1EJP8_9ZZZZ
MEKFNIAGVEINRVPIIDLLFNKTMIFAYILLAFGLYGIYEVINDRYFFLTANAFDAGANIGSHEVAIAMREAIFGDTAEVHRESPWTLYISNYMYMIYTGSGIIFLVALCEIFNVEIIKKTAAGFMTFGLAMIFGGLFTIIFDLNILHIFWMFKRPNFGSGMWLMLPLYFIYIPFVFFEIYLLITNRRVWAKKIAFIILLLSVLVDIAEYYIQAKLFDMNTARHLWTTYPALPLYFIVSSFLSAIGVMILYSYIVYQNSLGDRFRELLLFLKRVTLLSIIALASYEVVSFLFIDKKWAMTILFGGFDYEFYIYAIFALVIPFGLLLYRLLSKEVKHSLFILASLSIIIGTFIGRFIFVYGGNAYPMSDRFGTGFEKYAEYSIVQDFIFFMPPISEISIVIGSFGVVFAVYKILDNLFNVSKIRED